MTANYRNFVLGTVLSAKIINDIVDSLCQGWVHHHSQTTTAWMRNQGMRKAFCLEAQHGICKIYIDFVVVSIDSNRCYAIDVDTMVL